VTSRLRPLEKGGYNLIHQLVARTVLPIGVI
jgi:hypothetical protein